jgi:hypothetical protein
MHCEDLEEKSQELEIEIKALELRIKEMRRPSNLTIKRTIPDGLSDSLSFFPNIDGPQSAREYASSDALHSVEVKDIVIHEASVEEENKSRKNSEIASASHPSESNIQNHKSQFIPPVQEKSEQESPCSAKLIHHRKGHTTDFTQDDVGFQDMVSLKQDYQNVFQDLVEGLLPHVLIFR